MIPVKPSGHLTGRTSVWLWWLRGRRRVATSLGEETGGVAAAGMNQPPERLDLEAACMAEGDP